MSDASPGQQRIGALDIVRGFALCGVLLANVHPIAHATLAATTGPPGAEYQWLGHVYSRFFPIFSLLFGIGFALLHRSAATRVDRPRLVLLRRLLALGVAGAAHLLLWWGDILSTYAVVGLLVLLPSTWLPRWAVAGLGAAFLATALITGDSRFVVVSGLFLLGAALVRYGVVDRVEQSVRVPAVLGAAFAVSLPFADHLPLTAAGLLGAGLYVCVLLLLCHTPLRPVLDAVFAPLGRMAFTNYLTATVLVLAAARLVGGDATTWPVTVFLAVTGSIISLQWLWSALWLRAHRHGPLEHLWRWATWLRRP
ncbi:Uncharacterized membrane protein YeiB [Lentzea xinjiangensis]|uniref:Uncharacterized membrane protein YeiB n=2 Tax=Lentzea xinjiangensis TaxID=402600 RepID=A0A1H9TWN6_9PSEU|nr:Uncharacterized membrane protein YeiB [Lentzea xinjiangensis]